jgi:hypothetical protein
VFRSPDSLGSLTASHEDTDSSVAEYFVCKFYWLPVAAWHAVLGAGLHTTRSLREFY